MSKVDPDSTGLHPAWRQSAVHTVVGTTWPEGTSAEQQEAQRAGLREMTAQLRALAPDSGAYFNEVRIALDGALRACSCLTGVLVP